jgi:hypothetical protein
VGRLELLYRADERASDDRAWTANLAIFRIVFVAFVALPAVKHALRWSQYFLEEMPAEAWWPVSFFQLVPHSVLTDVSLARTLAVLDIGLLLLGLFGVATRWTLGLAAVLSTYVLGLSQNQVKVTQNGHILWFLALLAAGPSGRMLSVDALVRAIRGARAGRCEPAVGSPLALPTLRYVWVLFGLVFLAPGLAKLHAVLTGGWTADHLRAVLWHQHLELSHYQPGRPPSVEAAAGLPSWLLEAGGWSVIAFEVGFVVLVLFRVLRPLAAASGLAFHWLTGVVLRIRFAMLLPAYVALVDWAALSRWLRRTLRIPSVRMRPSTDRGRTVAAAVRSLDVLDVFEAQGPIAPDDARGRGRWLHGIGIALVAAQLLVSVVRVASMRAEGTIDDPETASRWSRWRWPFDAYPDFTRERSEIEMHEIRLRLADGREVLVPPSAFASTYGPAAKTSWLFEFALSDANAERRRARLVPLVRAVVDHAPEDLLAGATEASLHSVRYRIDGPDPPRRLEERVDLVVPRAGR